MRLYCCKVRDHINYRKNDRWRSYRFYRALQRLKSPIRCICEIFGAPRFSSFSTQSGPERTSSRCQREPWDHIGHPQETRTPLPYLGGGRSKGSQRSRQLALCAQLIQCRPHVVEQRRRNVANVAFVVLDHLHVHPSAAGIAVDKARSTSPIASLRLGDVVICSYRFHTFHHEKGIAHRG